MPQSRKIGREQAFYAWLKRAAERRGWLYLRLETRNQDGLPDCLVTRGPEYWLIEIKCLKKPRLLSIQDDLTWQFGQLAMLKKCLAQARYMLIVIHTDYIGYFVRKGAHHEPGHYPDFIGRL